MIKEFVDRFMSKKDELKARFAEAHPKEYLDLVRIVVEALHDPDEYASISPSRIHQIDDGDYQGTLVFVIAATGYQPNDYWYVKVFYGSCSGCDTLYAIHDHRLNTPPSEGQIADYMTLALHIVQGLKKMGD